MSRKPTHRIALVASLLPLLLLLLAPPGRAQESKGERTAGEETEATKSPAEDPRITRTKERYGFERWPETRRRWNGLPLALLRYDGYREPELEFAPGAPVTLVYATEDGVRRFLVELRVHETVEQARDGLVEALTFVSSPKPAPTAESHGISVGDVGFVGPSRGGRLSWIVFVRGNVGVRVVCLDPQADPHPDMRYLAVWTDRLLLAQPSLPVDVLLTRPVIRGLLPRLPVCTAGDAVPLDLEVDDAAAWWWVVGGPGQGYVERDEDGRWLLHTTRAGAIELTCHVLGSNGVAGARTTSIDVRED